MKQHWRPSLGFVIGGGLLGTLCVSLLGLVALRYLGPEIGFRNAAFVLAIGILFSTSVIGWLMVRLLLRPITQLRNYAAGQEKGADTSKPQNYGTREIEQTAKAVISMTEALRDREATVRSFTDHVVHELKTPISGIRAASELLQDGDGLGPEDLALLDQIDGARKQIEDQLEALRAMTRAREARYVGSTTLPAGLEVIQRQFAELKIAFSGDEESFPMAQEGLHVVLTHLLQNAQEHGATNVDINTEEIDSHPVLTVSDNGPGISTGNAGHIFEPFFTSRRDAGGTGMGLTIVRNILKAHGADIELLDRSPGAHFRITF